MLCITGNEDSIHKIKERVSKFNSPHILHEIRLDYLKELPTNPNSLWLNKKNTIITFRPKREGGAYNGDERTRLEYLKKCALENVGFIDLEADISKEFEREIIEASRKGITRVIRSKHIFNKITPQELNMVFKEVDSLPGHATKIAVTVDDPSWLIHLLKLKEERKRPLIVLGMGEAGLLSRILYVRFGSFLTYVATSKEKTTALGQLTLEQLNDMEIGYNCDPDPVVLLGNEVVYSSPGPVVYNRIFKKLNARMVYIPVATTKLKETLALLKALRFRGGSITMPFKKEIVNYIDEILPEFKHHKTINTVIRRGSKLYGMNSDGIAVKKLLRNVNYGSTLRGKKILIIGAGGAALATIIELLKEGASLTVINRTFEKAKALEKEFNIEAVPFNKLQQLPSFDILINATPLGKRSELIPIPTSYLKGKIVVDMNIVPFFTPLLKETIAQGGIALHGIMMWLLQGIEQLKLWLKKELPLQLMIESLPQDFLPFVKLNLLY